MVKEKFPAADRFAADGRHSPNLCPNRFARCWAYQLRLARIGLYLRFRFPSGMVASPLILGRVASLLTLFSMIGRLRCVLLPGVFEVAWFGRRT